MELIFDLRTEEKEAATGKFGGAETAAECTGRAGMLDSAAGQDGGWRGNKVAERLLGRRASFSAFGHILRAFSKVET